MHKWFIWFGSALVALGAALLTSLADLLPVDFAPYLRGDFAHSKGSYLHVVPAAVSTTSFLDLALLTVGLAVLVVDLLLRRRNK